MPTFGEDNACVASDQDTTTDNPVPRDTSREPAERTLAVYWRPGCPFCHRLLRALVTAEVTIELHNIWEDDDACDFVRQHNAGSETVPTVAIGDLVLTNPSPREFVELLGREYPDLLASSAPEENRDSDLEDPAGR